MIPRDYQTEAKWSVFKYFENNSGNPVIAMPTGTGKSIVIADLLQTIYQHFPNQRVMMTTHVKELIEQNYDKQKDFGISTLVKVNLMLKDGKQLLMNATVNCLLKSKQFLKVLLFQLKIF